MLLSGDNRDFRLVFSFTELHFWIGWDFKFGSARSFHFL